RAGVDALLTGHAEAAAEIKPLEATRAFWSFVDSRPRVAERRAIEQVISAAAATGGRAHIVHLSAADCVAMISGAKAAGIRLTVETCPPYLYFAAAQVGGRARALTSCPTRP